MNLVLENFLKTFSVTSDVGNGELPEKVCNLDVYPDFKKTVALLGGKSFDGGLFRVYRADQLERKTSIVVAAYPEYKNRIIVFAGDWLGRQFAVDYGRISDGRPQVLLIEIGIGKALNIPCSIVDFFNQELVEYTNDALALNFFHEWINTNNDVVDYSECIGYKIPLFLGGEDVLENLERINMELYIDMCGQLRSQTIHLADGTKISDVRIKQ